MVTKNLPMVGDVIVSSKFAYGYRNRKAQEVITVDGRTEDHFVTFRMNEEDRVIAAAKSGKIPPKKETVNLGAYDPSRAKAKFVIEIANMEGGGTGHGLGDVYPDGWHVYARRLNADGTYNPNGEVIHFYMSGDFNCKVVAEDVQVVGKMHMQFA